MSEQLGQSVYNQNLNKNQYIKDWEYSNFSDNAMDPDTGYGAQAKAMGDKIARAEKAGTTINVGGTTPESATSKGAGAAAAAAGKGADTQGIAAAGLIGSGNPYAMTAGGVLALDQGVRAKNQAYIDSQRKAYLDYYEQVRQGDMPLASMNMSV
jgi:hypothetical protein